MKNFDGQQEKKNENTTFGHSPRPTGEEK